VTKNAPTWVAGAQVEEETWPRLSNRLGPQEQPRICRGHWRPPCNLQNRFLSGGVPIPPFFFAGSPPRSRLVGTSAATHETRRRYRHTGPARHLLSGVSDEDTRTAADQKNAPWAKRRGWQTHSSPSRFRFAQLLRHNTGQACLRGPTLPVMSSSFVSLDRGCRRSTGRL
jgi:hypothetical protein